MLGWCENCEIIVEASFFLEIILKRKFLSRSTLQSFLSAEQHSGICFPQTLPLMHWFLFDDFFKWCMIISREYKCFISLKCAWLEILNFFMINHYLICYFYFYLFFYFFLRMLVDDVELLSHAILISRVGELYSIRS